MEQLLNELVENKNIRTNLSTLRQTIKDEEKKAELLTQVGKQEALFLSFLQSEDAKTRKNAALLFGDLAYQNALEALYEAYVSENTLFVNQLDELAKTVVLSLPSIVSVVMSVLVLCNIKNIDELQDISQSEYPEYNEDNTPYFGQ